MLRCGTAAMDITPKRKVPLCGGLFPRPSDGTADPLLARALYLETPARNAVLVGLDLICIPFEIVQQAIARAAPACGIAPEAFVVWSTHTHSGPYLSSPFGAQAHDAGPFAPLEPGTEPVLDGTWLEELPARIAEAVQAAQKNARGASAHLGVGRVPERTAYNRRWKLRSGKAINHWLPVPEGDRIVGSAGPIDPEVISLRLDAADSGEPLALFYTHACHCHGRWNCSKFAAGHPFAVQNRLAPLGRGPFCLFGQGAAADINGAEDWQGLGHDVAAAVCEGQRNARKLDGELQVSGADLSVPLRDFSVSQHDEIRRVAGRWQAGAVELFEREARFLREQGAREVRCALRALRLGAFSLVTSPGELFVEYGMELKQRSPFPWTSILSLANGYAGYLPTARAFEEGGYEILNARSSRVSLEGCRQLVEEAVRLLTTVG